MMSGGENQVFCWVKIDTIFVSLIKNNQLEKYFSLTITINNFHQPDDV